MEKITKSEMKEIIREEKILPSELFEPDSLTTDPFVKSFVSAATKETQGKLRGEAEQRRRGEDGLDKDRKEMEEKHKAIEDENKTLKNQVAKVKASELMSAKIKERKLPPHQIKYIDKKKDDFVPTDIENMNSEVEKFLDTQVEECKDMGKLFGVKEEPTPPKGGGEAVIAGTGDVEDITPD